MESIAFWAKVATNLTKQGFERWFTDSNLLTAIYCRQLTDSF